MSRGRGRNSFESSIADLLGPVNLVAGLSVTLYDGMASERTVILEKPSDH